MAFKYFSKTNRTFFAPQAVDLLTSSAPLIAGITRSGYIHIYTQTAILCGIDKLKRAWLLYDDDTHDIAIKFSNEKSPDNYAVFFYQGIARIYAAGYLKRLGILGNIYPSQPVLWDTSTKTMTIPSPSPKDPFFTNLRD